MWGRVCARSCTVSSVRVLFTSLAPLHLPRSTSHSSTSLFHIPRSCLSLVRIPRARHTARICLANDNIRTVVAVRRHRWRWRLRARLQLRLHPQSVLLVLRAWLHTCSVHLLVVLRVSLGWFHCAGRVSLIVCSPHSFMSPSLACVSLVCILHHSRVSIFLESPCSPHPPHSPRQQ